MTCTSRHPHGQSRVPNSKLFAVVPRMIRDLAVFARKRQTAGVSRVLTISQGLFIA
jgi:hypothetical protein